MDSSKKGIDALLISNTEKTFQFQDQLDSLPVPDLTLTLSKYLDSVKPHVTNEEYSVVESLVVDFATRDGKVLHEKLISRANGMRNWIEKWWLEAVYMEFRLPTVLVNMSGPGPYYFDIWKPEPGSMIPRCSLMLYFIVQFWQLIRKERIRPELDSRHRQLCMHQFRMLFNTCKIPGISKDHIVNHFKTESDGDCPCFMVVLCRGHIFKMDVVFGDGSTLTALELQAQLNEIQHIATTLPPPHPVSYFTSLPRSDWALERSRLSAIHPDNWNVLKVIEQALFVLGLDDDSPTDIDDLCKKAIFGDPSNKWFDKSMNFVVYENGLFISNCDHSTMDGMMLISSLSYVHYKLLEYHGQWTGSDEVRKLASPELLQFKLDAPLISSLQDCKSRYEKLIASVELHVLIFDTFGKTYLKSHRVHPDACVQMALQLAYYRMHSKFAPTYETATTRRFYHGRTETVRSCTPESCRWCEAMVDGDLSLMERHHLFLSAIDKHIRLMTEATALQGCDRHLLGLAMIAREENYQLPDLFTHPSFIKRMRLTISVWTEDQETSCLRMADEVCSGLEDIRHLLDSGLVTARL